jgi:hypothetical protein
VKRPLGGLLALLLAAGLARATTVRPASIAHLTRRATLIVEVRAQDSWALWNPEHTLISTYTKFQLIKTLKGESAQQIVVKQPGGEVYPYAQRIPGVRPFQPGEETLLFLRPSPSGDGTWVVVSLTQGNFQLQRAPGGAIVTSNAVAEVEEIHQDGSLHGFQATNLSLEELEERIREALNP